MMAMRHPLDVAIAIENLTKDMTTDERRKAVKEIIENAPEDKGWIITHGVQFYRDRNPMRKLFEVFNQMERENPERKQINEKLIEGSHLDTIKKDGNSFFTKEDYERVAEQIAKNKAEAEHRRPGGKLIEILKEHKAEHPERSHLFDKMIETINARKAGESRKELLDKFKEIAQEYRASNTTFVQNREQNGNLLTLQQKAALDKIAERELSTNREKWAEKMQAEFAKDGIYVDPEGLKEMYERRAKEREAEENARKEVLEKPHIAIKDITDTGFHTDAIKNAAHGKDQYKGRG